MEKAETEIESVEVIDGQVIAIEENTIVRSPGHRDVENSPRAYLTYVILPAIFLTVTLLGGLRLGATDNAFIFLKPALISLVFAALTLVLFFRSGMISLVDWIAEERPLLQNAANVAVLLAAVHSYNTAF